MNHTPNITWLLDDVATGGDLAYDPDKAEAQADAIIAAGITHIFDARIEDDDSEYWAQRGVKYLRVGVNDEAGSHLPVSFFDKAVYFARQAQREGGKILLHCHMGINRGPSAAVAVLIDRGMAPVEALKHIVARRDIAGVYFFMDAVTADAARRKQAIGPSLFRSLRNDWQRLVRNPEHIAHVQRSIRAGHNRDASERDAMRGVYADVSTFQVTPDWAALKADIEAMK